VPIKLPDGQGKANVLESTMTTLIPVWVRADQSGKHTIRILFIYHSKDAKEGETYRTLKITKTIDVHASIRVAAFTRISMVSLNEFILALEVTNIRSGSELIFRQLTSLCGNWLVSVIDEEYPILIRNITCTLKTNQTKHIYLRLTRRDHGAQKLQTTPEFLTTFALERLVLAEDPKPWQPTKFELAMCSIAQVSSTNSEWLFIRLSKGTFYATCSNITN
jgi:hypothetical protein